MPNNSIWAAQHSPSSSDVNGCCLLLTLPFDELKVVEFAVLFEDIYADVCCKVSFPKRQILHYMANADVTLLRVNMIYCTVEP